MTSNDAIGDVRKALDDLDSYERRYHPGEPAFRDTFGRLASAIGRLADEVERLRSELEQGGGVSGGGIEGPFVDNEGNAF